MEIFLEASNITLDVPIFDVDKSFRKSIINYCTGGQIMVDPTKNRQVNVRALENVNFQLVSGDRLGLIGHNGAGKTSLLRILAKVYSPSKGHLTSNGKVTSLFNMSIGLELDDTGIENISTVGMYLGMTPKEIENKRAEIIEFSDLGDFIHLPIRTYSSGMQLRLSFAIATALEPEILLLDEGISAGDALFAEKAKTRIDEFYKRLNILVIASHSDTLIKKLCNKALLLEHGKVKAYGNVDDVLETYSHQ